MDCYHKTFCYIALFILTNVSSFAWTIGSKGRVNGPTIHTTYFLTPNNRPSLVSAKAYMGSYVNGLCQYNAIYPLGTEELKTGDFIDIDAFRLRFTMGTDYNCMTIYYYYKQLVMETFLLIFDGYNYTSSYPATTEVSIL